MSIKNRVEFMINLFKSKLTGRYMPLEVVLNLTSRCNLRCRYCYGEYYQRNNHDFTTKEVLNLIDELATLGTKSITLGGGEPLLREDISEIIDYIKSKNIECGMNTNGTLIPKKIDAVGKLDLVCVSIDGDEIANDLDRGEGTFPRIMEGILCAKNNGMEVHTNTVLTKNSIKEIDWLMEKANEIGFSTEFSPMFFSRVQGANAPDLGPSNEEFRSVMQKIVDYHKKSYPIVFSQKAYEYSLNWPDYKKKIYYNEHPNFKYIQCLAGKYMCLIDSDGYVYPCAQLLGSFQALNFLEHGFKKAWEHLNKNNKCVTCYFPCFNEFNFIFHFDMYVILSNIIKTFKKACPSFRGNLTDMRSKRHFSNN